MEAGAASGTISTRRPRARLAAIVIGSAVAIGCALGFIVYLVHNAAQQQHASRALAGAASGTAPGTASGAAPQSFGAGVPHGGLYGQVTWAAGQLPAPAISGLRDQTGAAFSLSSLKGQTVVLTFLDSHCGHGCAQTERSLVAAERSVPAAQRPALVVVSVDPSATAADVRAAAQSAGLASLGRWYWLTGTQQQLAPVWSAYHIQVSSTAGGGSGSTRAVFMIDRGGYQRAGFVYPFISKHMATDMRKLAKERG